MNTAIAVIIGIAIGGALLLAGYFLGRHDENKEWEKRLERFEEVALIIDREELNELTRRVGEDQ